MPELSVYVLSFQAVMFCFNRNAELLRDKKIKIRMLECVSCSKTLFPGDLIVSKRNSHVSMQRDLDCAIKKFVLTTNVIDLWKIRKNQ